MKLEIHPAESGSGILFESNITGGVVPKEYIPSVERGIREASERGIIAGYPVVDVLVRLIDGSFHTVDSSEIAFKIAGSIGFQDGCRKAGMLLLEPLMEVEVVTPVEYTGEVIGDLNSRRGRINRVERRGETQILAGLVPLAEMFGYATAVRSLTQGRATYTMQFSQHGQVPTPILDEILAQQLGGMPVRSGSSFMG